MEKLFVLFVVFKIYILSVGGTENNTCDYTFGDPSWNYSKVFYNRDSTFPAGAKEHAVVLPAEKGLMISYVCITLLDDGMRKVSPAASFDPIDHEVSIKLSKEAPRDFNYNIFAKRHGY